MADRLDAFCDQLARRYGEPGAGAAARLREWMSGAMPMAEPEILDRHLDEAHLPLVFDAFWQVLPFGTGGRRGKVGYGANRMNPTTVAMTVEGHCRYLRQAFGDRDLAVVVANDVRVFADLAGTYRFLGDDHPLLGVSSRSLARLACEIYAGNGIAAYLTDPDDDAATLSTPELSFLIGRLGAVGGVNLSASHNPPDDNGIKVYDAHGSQPIAPDDQRLIDTMSRATSPRRIPLAQALADGLVRPVPPALHEDYVRAYVALYGGVHTPDPDAPIVYTPLCGVGERTTGDVLTRLGFPVLVPPDQRPDGSFAAIPYRAPNPEVAEATVPATRFADACGAGAVFSTDPDADRLGVEIKLADGSWYHLDGNQIAAVLCYYLMLDPEGPRRRGLVMETLVTTKILPEIVRRAGGDSGESWIIDDLLVGFKYVAHVLKTLARDGSYRGVTCTPADLVLATEESHGVLMLPDIRDKDAAPGCMFLAALYQRLRARGLTLLDYYVDILQQLGGFDTVNRSIMMSGAEGNRNKQRIMDALRAEPPAEFAGSPVTGIIDYHDQDRFGPFVSDSDRLPRDVIQIATAGCVVTVRPSGTEPKLKLYCQLLPSPDSAPGNLPDSAPDSAGGGATAAAAIAPGPGARTDGRALLAALRVKARGVADRAYNELLARMGASLGPAGLALPDIVDLAHKQVFESRTVPALRDALDRGALADLPAALAWLRREAAAMMPGADPLPALRAPLALVCGQWQDDPGLADWPGAALLAELLAWAEGASAA